jgi:hypothetical protein
MSMKISDIVVGLDEGINIEAMLISLEPTKEEYKHNIRTIIRNGMLKDDTGTIPVVFWCLDALNVKVGMKIGIVNGYSFNYMGRTYISSGKHGKTILIEGDAYGLPNK